ncbi:MAG TPA: hypothetical protein VMD47_08915 [Candidatus Acidoferrales bacterium]|nr:hypothetical protein [Candidatus Acidoferrales bacterium]
MKAALTAGSTFAAAVLLGFAGGLAMAHRTGSVLWVIGGFFAGVMAGALVAGRSLLQAGK